MTKAKKYELPAFLAGTITQTQYERWIRHKARAHVKRDRKRGNPSATNEEYNLEIHRAVIDSDGRDFYTGEALDWSLISTYENDRSKSDGRRYKATLALLPTVDHVNDGTGPADFKICSWRTNSAKNDLTLPEFVERCEKVVRHATNESVR
jgi:hypothetical protein